MATYKQYKLTDNEVWLMVHAMQNDAVDNTPSAIAKYRKLAKKLGYIL
jgi:hypothetical protein